MYAIPKSHQVVGAMVLLRTPLPQDYDQLLDILNDKKTMEVLLLYFKVETWTPKLVEERYEGFKQSQEFNTGLNFVIINNNKVVGNGGFKDIDFNQLRAEFSIILDKYVWGTQIAKECHLLCLPSNSTTYLIKTVI